MRKNVLHSPRLRELKRHRRNIFLAKIGLFIIGAVVVLGGLSLLSRSQGLNISSIEISGNKITDADDIRASVEEDLAGRYFWLFPKTNFLFYPKNKIQINLYNKFKRLTSIAISAKNETTLFITVSERVGLYTWCGVILPPVTEPSQKCYFMDETGFIFDEAPYFSGNVYFKFYGGVFQNDYGNFKSLTSFKENIEQMGLKPTALYVAEDGTIKILLSARSAIAPVILLNTNSDLEKVSGNLETALTTEPLQTEFKKIIEEGHRGEGKIVYDDNPKRLVEKVIELVQKEKVMEVSVPKPA